MNVELHIEELVLHGFRQDHLIGETVERELSRLFTERGVPPSLVHGGDIPHLDAGTFRIDPELGAEAVGVRLARSLYGGLGLYRNIHGEGSARQIAGTIQSPTKPTTEGGSRDVSTG